MIHRSPVLQQSPGPTSWQQQLADAIHDPVDLLRRLGLDPESVPWAGNSLTGFRLRVPHAYLSRIRKGDPCDPLLLQVLPRPGELEKTRGYSPDPLNETAAMPAAGLLHKYHGRVLLTLTGACAIHCRYCFRRHFPYADANPVREQWSSTLEYIDANPDITEVILSGGDPLSLPDDRLAALVSDLGAISHIKRLRIHTRLPVVLPDRVDDALCLWLRQSRLQKVLVTHINHASELDQTVGRSMQRLAQVGCRLLNQSVLLHRVNDSADHLAALSEALFAQGILPYYLHQLDPVEGAAHFAVSDDKAQQLMEELRNRLPGYLLPRLVREIAGHASKTPLG